MAGEQDLGASSVDRLRREEADEGIHQMGMQAGVDFVDDEQAAVAQPPQSPHRQGQPSQAIGLREDQMPPDQLEFLHKLRELLESKDGVAPNSGALSPEKSDAIIRSLEFHHAGARGESFTLHDESDGTLNPEEGAYNE